MIRRNRHDAKANGLPNWIVSYGDLVTTLLCFFIILSALAKDQTGVKLYAGLDSFKNRPIFPGIAGMFKDSSQTVQLNLPGPNTVPEALVDGPGEERTGGIGPENGKNRVIDIEEEQFQRFLSELERQFSIQKMKSAGGRTMIDLYEPLQGKNSRPGPQARRVIWQMVPILSRPNYRITIVLWAAMPAEGAWVRAARESVGIVEHIGAAAQLKPPARSRLIPQGRVWPHPDRARPVLSIEIAKTKSSLPQQ